MYAHTHLYVYFYQCALLYRKREREIGEAFLKPRPPAPAISTKINMCSLMPFSILLLHASNEHKRINMFTFTGFISNFLVSLAQNFWSGVAVCGNARYVCPTTFQRVRLEVLGCAPAPCAMFNVVCEPAGCRVTSVACSCFQDTMTITWPSSIFTSLLRITMRKTIITRMVVTVELMKVPQLRS